MSDGPSSRPGKGNSGRGGRSLAPPPSRSGRAPVEGRGGKGKGKGRGRGSEESATSHSSTPSYAATASSSRLSKSPPRGSSGGGPALRRSPSGRESSKPRDDNSARAKNKAEEAERLRKVAAKKGAASGDSDEEEPTDTADLAGDDGAAGLSLGLIDFSSMSVDDAADLIWDRMRAFMKDNGGAKALEMFKALDIDGDGTIDLGEFTSALADMGIHGVPTKMAKAVMSTADGDNNGCLEYAELVPMLEESREVANKKTAAARKTKDKKDQSSSDDGSEWDLAFDLLLYDQDLEDFDAENQGFYVKICAEALGVEEKQVQVVGVRESADDRALKVATLVKGCESEEAANDLGEKAKNLFVLAAALKIADLGRARVANTLVRDRESAAKAAKAKMDEERKAKAAAVSQEIKRIKEEEAAAKKKAEAAEAAAQAAREKAEESRTRKSQTAAAAEDEKAEDASSPPPIRVGSRVRVTLGRSTESGVVVAANDGVGPRPRGSASGHNAASTTYDVKLNNSEDGTEPLLVSAVPLSRLTPESAPSNGASSGTSGRGNGQKRPLQVKDQVIIAPDAPCMPDEAGVISAFRSVNTCDVHLSRSRMVFEGVPLRLLALQDEDNDNHQDSTWHEDWLVPGTSVTVLGPPGGFPLQGIVQAAHSQGGKNSSEVTYDVTVSSTGSMVTGVPAAKVIPLSSSAHESSSNSQASRASGSGSSRQKEVPDGVVLEEVVATFTAPTLGLTLGSNPQKGGAVVLALTAGGPAQLLGVHTGDVLRTIGNIKLDARNGDPAGTAMAHLAGSSRPVELQFIRLKSSDENSAAASNGETKNSEALDIFDLTLSARTAPKGSTLGATFALQPFQPAVAHDFTATTSGGGAAASWPLYPEKGPSDEGDSTTTTEALVVTAVEAQSPAEACGLRVGAAIVGMNGVYWHSADRRPLLIWASEVMHDLLASAARPAVLHCVNGVEKKARVTARSSEGNLTRKKSESSSPQKRPRANSTPVLNRRRSSFSSPYGSSVREPSPPRSTWHHLYFVHPKPVGCVLEAKKNAAMTAEAIDEAQERGEAFSKKDNVMDLVVRYCEKGSEAMLLGLRKGDRLHQVGTVVLGSKGTLKQAKELLNVPTRPLSAVFERPPKAASENEVASLPGMPAIVDYGSCDEELDDEPGTYSRLRFLRQPLFPLGLQVKVSLGRLIVTSVKELPPEAGQDYGIRAGDEIVEINGVPWSEQSSTKKRVSDGAPTAVSLRHSAGLGQSAYCFENLVASVTRPLVLTMRRAPLRNSCAQSCALALVRLTFASSDGEAEPPEEYEAPKGHKPAKYSVEEVEKARKAKKSAQPADSNKESRRFSFLSKKTTTTAKKGQVAEEDEEGEKPGTKKSGVKKSQTKNQEGKRQEGRKSEVRKSETNKQEAKRQEGRKSEVRKSETKKQEAPPSPVKAKPLESKRKKKVETPPQSSSSESSSSSSEEEEVTAEGAMLAAELAGSSSSDESGSDSEDSL